MRDVRQGARTPLTVHAVTPDGIKLRSDHVATEEPLAIRVRPPRRDPVTVAITMRTPGDDFELAAGYLFAEGLISGREDFDEITYCVEQEQRYNTVTAEMRIPCDPEPRGLVSSACGICGKTTLDALSERGLRPVPAGPVVPPAFVTALPDALRAAQPVFSATGGLHAAALFDPSGKLLAVREDVGRHNALDKLVGWAVLGSRTPLAGTVLLLSGRASYELVQKAVVAGIPFVCSVGAPSSLAVDVAARFGVTLTGFVREDRFNIYAGAGRISQQVAGGVGGLGEG